MHIPHFWQFLRGMIAEGMRFSSCPPEALISGAWGERHQKKQHIVDIFQWLYDIGKKEEICKELCTENYSFCRRKHFWKNLNQCWLWRVRMNVVLTARSAPHLYGFRISGTFLLSSSKVGQYIYDRHICWGSRRQHTWGTERSFVVIVGKM